MSVFVINEGQVEALLKDTNDADLDVREGDAVIAATSGIVVAGKDDADNVVFFRMDSDGRLVVSPGGGGAKETKVFDAALDAEETAYFEYIIPGGQTWAVENFYAGGTDRGIATLFKHVAGDSAFVDNGDFEDAGQVSAWPNTTGSGTPSFSTAQFNTGAGSMAVAYSQSGGAGIAHKQAFSSPVNMTTHRYLDVFFRTDEPSGTPTRTLSVTLSSDGGSGTRTWELQGVVGTAPFLDGTWIQLQCDLRSPDSVGGANFTLEAVTSIELKFADSANKSGTIHWDTVRLRDSLEERHKIYFPVYETKVVPTPQELFLAGEAIYMTIENRGTNRGSFTAVAAGNLS